MQYNNTYSISDNAINTLCRDKEGGIWAGTRFGGISYYPYPYTSFEKYFSQNGNQTISGNGVHEICPDQYGSLWIGTEDAGLNKMDTKTGHFKHFVPDGKKGSICYTNIHGLLVNGDELWIGTYQHGIDRMNLKTEKVTKHYEASNNSFNSNFIVHLYKTRSGDILVGTWEGLYKYNKASDDFSPVPGFPFQTQSIIEDKQGLLWICTLGNGVFSLDQKTGKINNLRHHPNDSNSLSNNMVNGLFIDSQENLWFATEGGLCKYDVAQKKI
jgi:ligand-binding sensor domain-containing protein